MLDNVLRNSPWLIPATLGILALVWTLVRTLRGYVGGQDVTFLALNLSPELPRKLTATPVRTDKLRDIMDNVLLRLYVTALFWARNGYLQVGRPGKPITQWERSMQQRLLNAIGDECSEIANAGTGMALATGVKPRTIRCIFGVTRQPSMNGRIKIRVWCISAACLDVLRKEGVERLELTPRSEYIRPVLQWMMGAEHALDSFDIREIVTPAATRAEPSANGVARETCAAG